MPEYQLLKYWRINTNRHRACYFCTRVTDTYIFHQYVGSSKLRDRANDWYELPCCLYCLYRWEIKIDPERPVNQQLQLDKDYFGMSSVG